MTAKDASERTESESRASDALYGLLVEHSTDMISRHTPEGVYTYASPACRSLLGYEPEELVGCSVYGLSHPEDVEEVRRTHSSALGRSDACTVSYRIRSKDGSYVWFETSSRAVRDPGTSEPEIAAVSRDISERRTSDEALREYNRRVTGILESITDAFFALDREWRFTYVNRQAERILQRTRDELLGKSLWEEFPEAVGARFYEKYHEAVESGTAVHFEEFYAPLGRWSEVNAYPSDDGLAVYFRDISQRKKAEEALHESEKRFKALYEDNPSMYFTLGTDGTVISVNRFGAEQLGYAPEELIGRPVLDIFHEEDREEASRYLGLCLRGCNEAGAYEARKVRKDGSVLWVAERIRVVRSPDDGRVILAACEDVTERKRAEGALRESEERYRAFFETAAVGAAEVDLATGRLLQVNDKLCRLLGYGRDELLAMKFIQITHPDDRARNSEGVARLKRGDIREYVTEKRYLRRDGGVVWVQLAVALVRDGDAQPLHSVAIMQDITERKRVEEALAREVRAKSDFLADVSHELRTPLTVIHGNAEVGLRLGRDWAHVDLLGEIVKESATMSRMVEDLLFLARSDSDSFPLDLETIPVARILGGLERRAEALAREHGASLKTSFVSEGSLRCDPERIEQAVLVLVDNAFKYGPPGGQVTLSSSTRRGELLIEVADRGPGIPPEELPHVFERYYRGQDSSRERGSGLGLPIAEAIARAHGGRIEPESRPGEGTRMRLHLPLAEGP